MSSQEGMYKPPRREESVVGQRDSGHLAVSSSSAAVRHRAGAMSLSAVERAYGQTTEVEADANQRLILAK
jgi:hypothetical protein